jgi:phosphoribosylformylglycinamidine synthase subunit PurS
MKFEIIIAKKSEVLDPEARAILGSLHSLGYEAVSDCLISRRFVLDVNCQSQEEGMKLIHEIGQKVLANPVSETFEVRHVL